MTVDTAHSDLGTTKKIKTRENILRDYPSVHFWTGGTISFLGSGYSCSTLFTNLRQSSRTSHIWPELSPSLPEAEWLDPMSPWPLASLAITVLPSLCDTLPEVIVSLAFASSVTPTVESGPSRKLIPPIDVHGFRWLGRLWDFDRPLPAWQIPRLTDRPKTIWWMWIDVSWLPPF